MPSLTIFAKRQKDKNRRATLKAKGICIACASERVGLNLDGTKSVRCETCQIKCTGRRHKKPTPKYDFNKSTPRTGEVDAPDSRENEVFETYMDTVKAIILASDGMTSRAIKAELGELNDEQFTSWALDRLCASDEVDEIRRGSMVYYVKAAPREPIKSIVIDREKLKEFKEAQRKYYAAYATGGYELQERA